MGEECCIAQREDSHLTKLFSDKDDILMYREKSSSSIQHPNDPFEDVLENAQGVTLPQRRLGPDNPLWKIPPSEWPTVPRRVEQGESLRQIGREYGVSYEAVRRVIRVARHR